MHLFTSKISLSDSTFKSPNLSRRLNEDDEKYLKNRVYSSYQIDLQSRTRWEGRMQAGMDLALQMSEEKNFPWPNCSNVAFPLVTIAALQFHARAYPALVQAPNIVRCRTMAPDPEGKLEKISQLISRHMSWQVLEQDECWEEQHDRLLFNLAIVGCSLKKTYHRDHNRSDLVLAQDFIVDYWAKSVESARRKTQRIYLSHNDIFEGVRRGIYHDVLDDQWFNSYAPQNATAANQSAQEQAHRQGLSQPASDADTPFTCLEQHCYLDLDGDGYQEPYIVTIEESSKTILRLVTGFESEGQILRNKNNQLVSITPTEYFTKYDFLPSPDGGFYGLGLGTLLGPINESTNAILNQMIDAGTMQNTKGGFLGRGVKIRGGNYTFAPLEWKRVDSTGDDLKKNIVPLEVGEPSQVLFQLLQLLINYAGRVSGATDTITGENPGQNTPATTTQAMVEQGLKIYQAVYKRVWRSMKNEFQKLYKLNSLYLPAATVFGPQQEQIIREVYKGNASAIVPYADPNITSDVEGLRKALQLKQFAATTPGYNRDQVEKQVLLAMKVENPEVLYPGIQKAPPPPNPKVMVEQIRLQAKKAQIESQEKQFLLKLMEQHDLTEAKIQELMAQVENLQAQARGVETGHQIAAINSMIAMFKQHDESVRAHMELALEALNSEKESVNQQQAIPGMAGESGDPAAATMGQSRTSALEGPVGGR